MVPQRSNHTLVVGLVFALCFGATAWAQTLQYGVGDWRQLKLPVSDN